MKKSTFVQSAALLLATITIVSMVDMKTVNGKANIVVAINEGDWPTFQHDASHSGRTSATITNTGPLYAQWAYPFGERVDLQVQPIFSNGVLYIGAMSGEMHAIIASTGQALWVARPGGPIAHTAAVENNRVFFGSVDGKIYALDANNGTLLWNFQTAGPIFSAPAVVEGRVFIGSSDGNLYALDANTGTKIWQATTGGSVISSPAVRNGKVYFGSEDLFARAVNASNGTLIWSTKLYGSSMRNTYPIISDNGNTVIFFTVKPGQSSYIPVEEYPNASTTANPIATWNTYYQTHSKLRTLYYLNANSGADLWNPASLLYVPLPIPYWGLLSPILHPDGSAWFPAPAGTTGYGAGNLDHDNRMFRIDLTTGVTEQRAGGSLPEFQLRPDEVGRHTFSGSDYYYTISEDLGVFRPTTGTTRTLFSNGDPSGYNFGTHMDPHSPLPSRHLWRYGGAISMGGVPGASAPIVANNSIYYLSYGWLYALGTQNQNQYLADDIPPDHRLNILTYPRSSAPTISEIQTEIERRVTDIVSRGANNPPITARWEQPGGSNMLNNEFTYEVYGFDADLVRVLSETYPLLPENQKTQLGVYLAQLVDNTLLNLAAYQAGTPKCIIYGQEGIFSGWDTCDQSGIVRAKWLADNPNLTAMRFYALWAYANATDDWGRITDNWTFIRSTFYNLFINSSFCKPHPEMHFCVFEEWRVGRLNIGAQIEVAQAVRDMAAYQGDTQTYQEALGYLQKLLTGRLLMANFVPNLYAQGIIEPARIRLNREAGGAADDYRIYNPDIMGSSSPYNNHLIPYRAELRDATNDPSQLNWWFSENHFQVDEGIGFMYYPALSGYFPLSTSLVDLLHDQLYSKTVNYVNSFEVNHPWWWLTDLAVHTTSSGEHLYNSPTLAWTLFQTKAHVLREDWDALAHQLPEPVSFNAQYDLYRLQNLVTLATLPDAPQTPDLRTSNISVSNLIPPTGEIIRYTIVVRNTGAPVSSPILLTDPIPVGIAYIDGSLGATCGTSDDSQSPLLQWTGTLDSNASCTLQFDTLVTETNIRAIQNLVQITTSDLPGQLNLGSTIIANGYATFLPIVAR